MSVGDMVRVFRERGYARSKPSILCRAEGKGIDLFRTGITANEVCQLFGVGTTTVKSWIRLRFITGHAYGRFWVFEPSDIEAFIHAQPWAYDVERMSPGPMRQLAEVVHRRDPWLPLVEAARLAGCKRDNLSARIRSGEVEARRRPGYNGAILIRASSLPAIRESVRLAWQRSGRKARAVQLVVPRIGLACPGCGQPVPAGRRRFCSDRCAARIWALNNRAAQRAARTDRAA